MKFWQQLLSKLKDKQTVYLLTVVENIGSSPGRKGFRMFVAENHFIFGSIGGGVMEHTLVEDVKSLLAANKLSIFLKRQVHRGNKQDGSGMICSGEQTIVFHPLSSSNIPTVESILTALQTNVSGTLSLTPTAFSFNNEVVNNAFNYKYTSNEDWMYKEHIGYKNALYIVGGGHVGVAVSELFNKLGFYVLVFDNRNELNTFKTNATAHHKQIVDYNDIANFVAEGVNSYVVIMTNKYTEDKLILSKLLNKNFKYIGVLGSKAKIKTMRKEILKDGFSAKALNEVYAPIGLPIKSQTPEEIAVSIAAQVIQIKNESA